jgi:acyl-CoA synthetase (NDP forming)
MVGAVVSGRHGSLASLFDPKVIAIIGASNNVLNFGGRPIRFLKEAGYAGAIYPINPCGAVRPGRGTLDD